MGQHREKNIDDILIDHAFCEPKGGVNGDLAHRALPRIYRTGAGNDLARQRGDEPFKLVHDRIIARGKVLGRCRKDEYVLELLKFFPKGGDPN